VRATSRRRRCGRIRPYAPDTTLYLVDDSTSLSPQRQIDAFALFNQVREHGAYMVSTGPVPPAVLPVREDLRTRMGWGLVYQVHGLSDDQKIAALTQAAEARGLTLSASVLPYLLSHFKRDMRSLSTMLDALDQYSLETQRPVTLPAAARSITTGQFAKRTERMKNLALFDLDHTLLPIDSDYEWGRFLVRHGVVDAAAYQRRNDAFFAQYQAGTLDPVEYLEFVLGTLAGFDPAA
jgi:hypothetical protein